jgi:hypothetical protein
MFGRLKPTVEQIGWAAGFCDAAAQRADLDDVEVFALLSLSFANSFGSKGPEIAGKVVRNQEDYFPFKPAGGEAFLRWSAEGATPVMPFWH